MKSIILLSTLLMPLFIFGQTVQELNDQAWKLRNKSQAEAITLANKAVDQAAQKGDKAGEAEAHLTLGLIHLEQKGDHATAKTHLLKAATLYGAVNNQKDRSLVFNKLGVLFSEIQQYSESISYFKKELALLESMQDQAAIAVANMNIGTILTYQGQHQEAIPYFQKSLDFAATSSGKEEVARYHNQIGAAYTQSGSYEKAEHHFDKAKNLAIQASAKSLLAEVYKNMAELYMKTGDTKKALHYNEEYTDMRNTVLNEQSVNVVDVVSDKKEQEKKQVESALQGEKSKVQEKDRELSEKEKVVTNLSMEKDVLEITKAGLEKDKEILEKEKALTQLELDYQIKLRNYLILGLGIFLMLGVIIFFQYRKQRKTNRELTKRKAEIEAGKKRSDDLLLNILPASTAEELKQNGKVEAKHYEEVTVLFTDFKDFTKVSEQLSPAELVKLIDRYFSEFDRIIKKHGVEKIKTIGDAYMCGGGLPDNNQTHAMDVANAALEIQQYILKENRERQGQNLPVLPIRLGIHTGPVVAGVVGINKFQYDIWGDTVNTASRMESGSEPGKINISGFTYELLQQEFQCVYRGKIEAKNKGHIDMYFLEGRSKKRASSEVKNLKGEGVKLSGMKKEA